MDADRFVRRGQLVQPRYIICYNCKKEGHYTRDCHEKVDLRRFTMEELALALSNHAIPGEDAAGDEDVTNPYFSPFFPLFFPFSLYFPFYFLYSYSFLRPVSLPHAPSSLSYLL